MNKLQDFYDWMQERGGTTTSKINCVFIRETDYAVGNHYISVYICNVMYISDERVEDWFLIKTPVPISVIFVMYVLLVFIGPRFMRNREALQLKAFIVPYNFILILLSIYMFFEVGKHIGF